MVCGRRAGEPFVSRAYCLRNVSHEQNGLGHALCFIGVLLLIHTRLEEGVLDTARLTRVITDPTVPLSFKQEDDSEFRDTVVTLLLDNSGSMRGRPIMVAALCADI